MSESIKTSSTYNAYDICAIRFINQRFKSPNLRENLNVGFELRWGVVGRGKKDVGCGWVYQAGIIGTRHG